MPPDPPTVSGLRPSVSQGTCLLTSQCPSTSKVNENREWASLVIAPLSQKVGQLSLLQHVEKLKYKKIQTNTKDKKEEKQKICAPSSQLEWPPYHATDAKM